MFENDDKINARFHGKDHATSYAAGILVGGMFGAIGSAIACGLCIVMLGLK